MSVSDSFVAAARRPTGVLGTGAGRRLAGVLVVAVVIVASALTVPVAAGGSAGAGPPADATAGASTTADHRVERDGQRPLHPLAPCATTPSAFGSTANATTVGTNVAFADGSPPAAGAAAATVADGAITDDRPTTQAPPRTRRPVHTRTLCRTR